MAKKLNIREKRLVKAQIEGKTQLQSWKEAGYSVNNRASAAVEASKKINAPHIQQAIQEALEITGATPEWAVLQIKKVAEQDEELASKRLASMNILELHGWQKNERPTLQLQVKNAFFGESRKVIDAEDSKD